MTISKSNLQNKIGFIILLQLLLLSGCYTFQKKKEISKYLPVIPLPVSVEELPDSCKLTDPLIIYYSDQALLFPAEYLREWLDTLFNNSTKIVLANDTSTWRVAITLTLDDQVKQDDGYLLEIGDKVKLTGKRPAGVFYGVQTLLQLIYANRNPGGQVVLPAMKITDYPRFSWRGMHLDVSRHFFDKEFVKRYLDILALHKMNTFHWHLVDDQGWRIEIKKYPKLTGIGAWRADREEMPWDSRTPQLPSEKASYGGFYTQDDIREIVDYAASRFITIVPEIEMPAHCSSALAAYPQFSCSGE